MIRLKGPLHWQLNQLVKVTFSYKRLLKLIMKVVVTQNNKKLLKVETTVLLHLSPQVYPYTYSL